MRIKFDPLATKLWINVELRNDMTSTFVCTVNKQNSLLKLEVFVEPNQPKYYIIVMCVYVCHINGIVSWLCKYVLIVTALIHIIFFPSVVAVPCRSGLQSSKPTVTQTLSQSDGNICQKKTQSPAQHPCPSNTVSLSSYFSQYFITRKFFLMLFHMWNLFNFCSVKLVQ